MAEATVEITSRERATWPVAILIGSAFGGGGLFLFWQNLQGGPHIDEFELPFSLIPWIIAAGFTAMGGLVLYLGLRALRQAIHWGRTPLLPDPHPGNIGGDVGGRILFPRRAPTGEMTLRLECEETRITRKRPGGRSKTRRSRRILFSREGRARVQGREVQFRFEVPPGHPQTVPLGHLRYEWRVVARSAEGDLERTWVLPVIEGEARSSLRVDSEAAVTAEEGARAESVLASAIGRPVDVPGAPGWSVRVDGSTIEVRARSFRNLSIALFLLPFSAFIAFVVGMVAGGPGGSLAPAALETAQIVAIGVTAVPLFLLAVSLPLIGHRNTISPEGATAVMTLAGIPIRSRRCDKDDIRSLAVRRKGTQNTSNQPIHAVQAERPGGDAIVIANAIESEQQAEALRDAMAARLGY